jgi:hypothetical protein
MVSVINSGGAGTPLFVKRLDHPSRGYYLVPWVNPSGIVLIVEVDASTGSLSSVVPLAQPMPRLGINPTEARSAVTGGSGGLSTDEPQLVWQPCRESASPLRPFYQVDIDAGHVYVDMDGKVYTNLTPFSKGG